MKVRDLTSETIETLNWLESESGFAREGPKTYLAYHANRIIYKKTALTITVRLRQQGRQIYFLRYLLQRRKANCPYPIRKVRDISLKQWCTTKWS
jgi:hypothetical protein